MTNFIPLKTTLLIAAVLLLFSCAKAPEEEMQTAETAVAGAEADSDIRVYAPDTLKRAKDTLNLMHAEAEAKRYDAAKAHADEAVRLSRLAQDEALEAKNRAGAEARALINTLSSAAEEAEQALDAAWLMRNPPFDVDALILEMETYKRNGREAVSELDAENYGAATDKARSARSGFARIVETVSAQIRAGSPKK